MKNLRIRSYKYDWLVWLMLIGGLCLRPTMFGESYNTYGVGMVLFAGIMSLRNTAKVKKDYLKIFALITVYWLYILIQSAVLLESGYSLGLTFNSAASNILVAAGFMLFLQNSKFKERFCKLFIWLLIILAISAAVTYVLVFLGVNMESLYYAHIKYAGGSYEGAGRVYFPFTITYNRYYVFGTEILRFLSIFRECGIAPIFYAWSFYYAEILYEKSDKKYKLIRLFSIIAIFMSFSFSGYLAFGISLILGFDWKNKEKRKQTFLFVLIIVAGIYIMSTISDMSILGKTQSGSLTDRTSALENTVQALQESVLFGTGFANVSEWMNQINFIGSIGSIGIVGAILYFLPYVGEFYLCRTKKNLIQGLSVLIITMLFAQPIAGQNLIPLFCFIYLDSKDAESNV